MRALIILSMLALPVGAKADPLEDIPKWCTLFLRLNFQDVVVPFFGHYCGCQLAAGVNRSGIYLPSPQWCEKTVEELKMKQAMDTDRALLCYHLQAVNQTATIKLPVPDFCR